jgi:hypothetical protein
MWLLRFRVYALSVGSAPSRVSSLGKPGNPTLLCGCVVLRSRVCDLSVGSAPSRDSNLGKPRNPTLLYGCVAVACYRKDVGPPVRPRTSRIATTRTPREAPGSHYKPKARKAPGTPGKPQGSHYKPKARKSAGSTGKPRKKPGSPGQPWEPSPGRAFGEVAADLQLRAYTLGLYFSSYASRKNDALLIADASCGRSSLTSR